MGVIGSGPAGAAIVLALLGKNVPVIWLRRPLEGTLVVGEHLAPEGNAALDQLDLDGILDPSDHLSSPGVVSYWGGPPAYERDYIFNPNGSGWNLDRSIFDQALLKAARRRGAEILEMRSVGAIDRMSDNWRITANTPTGSQRVDVSFVVDATGRNASVVRRLGYRPIRLDRLVGVFALMPVPGTGPARRDTRLLIEPMADGWWYSLPLQNRRTIAVYLTDIDLHPSGVRSARQVWRERFAASEATKIHAATEAEPQAFGIFPAHSQWVSEVAGEGWMTVGDACMAFDPLAGHGITKALQDALPTSDTIIKALNGCRTSLEAHARDRRSVFSDYLTARHSYYRQEKRWPRSRFWQRRQSQSAGYANLRS